MNMPARICATTTRPLLADPEARQLEGGQESRLFEIPAAQWLGVDTFPDEFGPAARDPAVAAIPSPKPARTGIVPAPSTRSSDSAAFTLLDRDERLIILLSRSSSRLSALAPRWSQSLFRSSSAREEAVGTAREIADRQAALRRFAILYRLDRGGLAFSEEERLAEAGYSEAQASVIRGLVERFDETWSPPPRSWLRMLILFVLTVGGASLLYQRLATGIDDLYVASLLSIVIVTGVISFFAVTARPNSGSGRSRSSAGRK